MGKKSLKYRKNPRTVFSLVNKKKQVKSRIVIFFDIPNTNLNIRCLQANGGRGLCGVNFYTVFRHIGTPKSFPSLVRKSRDFPEKNCIILKSPRLSFLKWLFLYINI